MTKLAATAVKSLMDAAVGAGGTVCPAAASRRTRSTAASHERCPVRVRATVSAAGTSAQESSTDAEDLAVAGDLATARTAVDLEVVGAAVEPGAVGADGCSIRGNSRSSFSLSSRKCRAMDMT